MTLLADVVATSRRVADTPSRNAKIAELAALLRTLAPAEIGIGAAYLSGEPRQGRSGIGYGLLRDARPDVVVGAPSLTIAEVDAALERLSGTTGAGSRSERTRILSALLGRATTEERDFLGRLMLGELRQGALESLMIDAVAAASSLPASSVRQAAMVAGGIAAVAHAALTEGAGALRRFALELMQPIAPMLAQPANDVAEALGMLGSAAFEWKLDGARVQVHKAGAQVRIFTRNRNDVTASAPEIVDALRSDDAPVRAHARRVGHAGVAAAVGIFLRLPAAWRRRADRSPAVGALRHPVARAACPPLDATHRDGRNGCRAGFLRRCAAARTRRRDGEVAERALRGGSARGVLAQDQACAHPGPGRARRGVGSWPAQRMAVEPASGRPRRSRGRVRDARQDIQGHDRRNARLADRSDAGARDLSRRMDCPRAAGTRRRNRVQRPAGQSALSRGTGVALRSREALPYGQIG